MKWVCKTCGTITDSDQSPCACQACGADEFSSVPFDKKCPKCGWEYYSDDAVKVCGGCGHVFGHKAKKACRNSHRTNAVHTDGSKPTRRGVGSVRHKVGGLKRTAVIGLIGYLFMWLSGVLDVSVLWHNVIELTGLLTFVGTSICYFAEAKTGGMKAVGCLIPILMFFFMMWATHQLGWWGVN